MSSPAPRQNPRIMAMTGFASALQERLITAWAWSYSARAAGEVRKSPNSEMSAPETKALSPAPVSTTTRTSGSACSASSRPGRSARISPVSALRLPGSSGRWAVTPDHLTGRRPWPSSASPGSAAGGPRLASLSTLRRFGPRGHGQPGPAAGRGRPVQPGRRPLSCAAGRASVVIAVARAVPPAAAWAARLPPTSSVGVPPVRVNPDGGAAQIGRHAP